MKLSESNHDSWIRFSGFAILSRKPILGGEMTCTVRSLVTARPDPNPTPRASAKKREEVLDHASYASVQLQHCRRTFPRRHSQEEAGGLYLSALWHRGGSRALCDRGVAGGFAEWRLLAGRGSPLRPERHPLAL